MTAQLPLVQHRPSANPQRYRGRSARAQSNLNRLLASRIRYSANGRKVVSHATINDRNKFFGKLIRDLHQLGYQLVTLQNLKPKTPAGPDEAVGTARSGSLDFAKTGVLSASVMSVAG